MPASMNGFISHSVTHRILLKGLFFSVTDIPVKINTLTYIEQGQRTFNSLSLFTFGRFLYPPGIIKAYTAYRGSKPPPLHLLSPSLLLPSFIPSISSIDTPIRSDISGSRKMSG